MIVVADSSVLIGLSSIGQLGIIYAQFSAGVHVTSAVWREVVEQGQGRAGAQEVETAKWITLCDIRDRAFVQYLKMSLDDGEAESIGLARELGAGLILLDERDARDVAKCLGFKVLGTIGLLLWAKQTGKIKNLKPFLDELQDLANFRFSKSLYVAALQKAGE